MIKTEEVREVCAIALKRTRSPLVAACLLRIQGEVGLLAQRKFADGWDAAINRPLVKVDSRSDLYCELHDELVCYDDRCTD